MAPYILYESRKSILGSNKRRAKFWRKKIARNLKVIRMSGFSNGTCSILRGPRIVVGGTQLRFPFGSFFGAKTWPFV